MKKKHFLVTLTTLATPASYCEAGLTSAHAPRSLFWEVCHKLLFLKGVHINTLLVSLLVSLCHINQHSVPPELTKFHT